MIYSQIPKAVFVAEMEAHYEADRIDFGHYWNGKTGCGIGCGVQSIGRLLGCDTADDWHAIYAQALGIPEWLAHVFDALFEGLQRPEFPIEFAEALPEGGDLSGLHAKFIPWLLRDMLKPIAGVNSHIIERIACGVETSWTLDDREEAGREALIGKLSSGSAYRAAMTVYYATRVSPAATATLVSGVAIATDYNYKRMADKLLEIIRAS